MKGGRSAFTNDVRFKSRSMTGPASPVSGPLSLTDVAATIPEIQTPAIRRPLNALERASLPKDLTYSEDLVSFIKDKEGFEPIPANDPGVGYPTIGYGHKLKKGYDPKMVWTKPQAEAQLRRDMDVAVRGVRNKVRVPITQGMMNGLTSMFYNIGPEKFPGTQADKKLHAGDYLGAAIEMLTFDNVRKNGKLIPLKGLTDRRRLEAEMAAGPNKHLLPPDRPRTK